MSDEAREEEVGWSEWSKGADTGYFTDSNNGLAHVQIEMDDGRVIEDWVQGLDQDYVYINDEQIDMLDIKRTRIQTGESLGLKDPTEDEGPYQGHIDLVGLEEYHRAVEAGEIDEDDVPLIDAEDTYDHSRSSSAPVPGQVEFDKDF